MVAVLVFAPLAAGSTDPGEVVTYSQNASQLEFETLDGNQVGDALTLPQGVYVTAPSAAGNGTVAFTDGGFGQEWLIDSNSQTTELDTSANDDRMSISPNGSKVVFVRWDPATEASNLYVVKSDGSGLTLAAAGNGIHTLTAPAFSPDGSTIAYWCGAAPHPSGVVTGCGPLVNGTHVTSGLMLMNVDGTDKRLIVIGSGSIPPTSISWSPDGKWLTTDSCDATCSQGQIFAYRSDGSDLFEWSAAGRQVTHEAAGNRPAYEQFCGSSSQILFVASNRYYAVERDGTNEHQLQLSGFWGSCIPPATGPTPPATVDATKVKVPSVRGLRLKVAKKKLAAANLRARSVKSRYSGKVPKGRVLAQSPKAGATVHRNARIGPPVNLTVSRGKRP